MDMNIRLSGGVLKMSRGYLIVMKDLIENGLYVLQGRIMIGSALIVEFDTN